VDPATLLGGVRLAIDPKAEGIAGVKVGSAATGRIVVATRPGLKVPETALRRSIVGADELVVCDGNVAKIAAVTIGQRSEHGIEIASGIKPGDRVVIDHVLGIEDGQALTPAGKGEKAEAPSDGKGVAKPVEDEATKSGDKPADKAGDRPAAPGSGH
jgi:hypothetical protein